MDAFLVDSACKQNTHAIRRGGYQPPAQYKVKTAEMSGEFVPVSHICTIQPNTQFCGLAGGW